MDKKEFFKEDIEHTNYVIETISRMAEEARKEGQKRELFSYKEVPYLFLETNYTL